MGTKIINRWQNASGIWVKEMEEIFITHCSGKKDENLKTTGEKVTPNLFYIGPRKQGFMKKCKDSNVNWAIFSDKYGIWFSHEKRGWYNKPPNTVTEEEFEILVKNFEEKLADFKKIYFYYNPARFHRLYKKLLTTVNLKERIVLITHLHEIKKGLI